MASEKQPAPQAPKKTKEPAPQAPEKHYAPPSLSVRVVCDKGGTHSMSGLFVILKMAVPGPPHPAIDKVLAVHDGPETKPDPSAAAGAPPPENPDAAALASRFVCTIVDTHGFLQPVGKNNPWHEIFSPDAPAQAPKKGEAPKNRDVARIPVDTDGEFVGCLLRHPQPAVARALTAWLNGGDAGGYDFDHWPKARTELLKGEKAVNGRELLARKLKLTKDTTQGTQLVLAVSESAEEYLPKVASNGGWLLYRDMPHKDCPEVRAKVAVVQKRLGLLRFPIGSAEHIYEPAKNKGVFDPKTLSAVLAFQTHAASGKAKKPVAWPPNHQDGSDGKHDWWFVIGDEVDAAKVAAPIPGCVDETTSAAIDAWIAAKVCKRGMCLVKNPSTYMRWDAALAVIAWRKLAAAFGVHYPQSLSAEETELATQYSLAELEANIDKTYAHPHKTGHAIDFGVVTDDAQNISDGTRPRANWPIRYEANWWTSHWPDTISRPRANLEAAKKALKTAGDVQKARAAAEKTSDDALGAVGPADPKRSKLEAEHNRIVEARAAADKDVLAKREAVDEAQKVLDAAVEKDQKDRNDPLHRGWAIRFRLYAHSRLDAFGDSNGAFDEVHRALDSVTTSMKTALKRDFGDVPDDRREAFLDEQLKFLSDFVTKTKDEIGPPDRRNEAGRASVRGRLFRASVRQWQYNPYARGLGSAGDEIRPDTDAAPLGYLDVEADYGSRPNVPPGMKSFVNLTYLGWICRMYRISARDGEVRDPHVDGKKAPRRPISVFVPNKEGRMYGRIVGLVERMLRPDSSEKDEKIICSVPGTSATGKSATNKSFERHASELDVDFMRSWAKALPAIRPRSGKTLSVVSTADPQVTLELTATDDGLAQLQAVFDKLSENGKASFALVSAGDHALLDADLIQASGKPALVAADRGTFATGSVWREKIENTAKLFKEKVAPANVSAEDKIAAKDKKKRPTKSASRDPKEWQIVLQPVFEKVAPQALDEVAFQPSQTVELPAPGFGGSLEWWHYQHEDSMDKKYNLMLADIGYDGNLLFTDLLPPEVDEPGTYAGRGIGANKAQDGKVSLSGPRPSEPENAEGDSFRK